MSEKKQVRLAMYAGATAKMRRSQGCPSLSRGSTNLDIGAEIPEVDVAGSFHAPIWPKPAITLSRKDWHSSANGAVL
jgi:hypothetical protein